jgi:hypothetical protein
MGVNGVEEAKGFKFIVYHCWDVAVTQINYPNLNTLDSIKQVRGRSYKEYLVQIFMLDDMQFFWEGGGFEVIYAIVEENNQAKLNKLENIKRTNLGFK